MDGRNNGSQADHDGPPGDASAVRSTVPLALSPSGATGSDRAAEPGGPAESAEDPGPVPPQSPQSSQPSHDGLTPATGAVDLYAGPPPAASAGPAASGGPVPDNPGRPDQPGAPGPAVPGPAAPGPVGATGPAAPSGPIVPGGPGRHLSGSGRGPAGPAASRAAAVPQRLKDLVNRRRDATAERAFWTEHARAPLTRPVRVVVASAGGGLGKTTVSLVLSEMLAGLRADGVAVMDAQPLGGTVGARVRAQPGWGLAGLIGSLDDVLADGSYSAWSKWATVEHTTRLTVFGRQRPFDGEELTVHDYVRLSGGLMRLWPLLVIDTGAPEGRSALQLAVIGLADVLVVVGAPGSATVAATAGWLRDISIPVERRVGAIVPLTGGDPDEVDSFMHSVCGQVAHIPVDKALAAEAAVPMLSAARGRTQDAVTKLAGMVITAATRNPLPGSPGAEAPGVETR